jgi:anti-sigma regulatory factor (Ser/Thr protein kinase)
MDFYLRFLVPSDPRFLSVVRAAITELASAYGLPEKECCRIRLAVDEAVANIIRHAYHDEPERPIELTCTAYADRLEFALLDQGEPPDPARIQAEPLDEMAPSGRGTHLIRMIMDEVSYAQVPGGNQLRLTKRLPTPTAGVP